jgi:hypothetical protein
VGFRDEKHPEKGEKWRRRLPLVGLFVVLLGSSAWRAGFESSLWMDEVFALQVTRHALPELFELAAVDLSPPLFYLALRGWLRAGGWLGMQPSVALARGMNLVAWAVLALGLARAGVKLRARIPPVLLLLAVAGSAHALSWAIELRTYALAFAALTLGFALLVRDLDADASAGGLGLAGWAAYVLCGALALGSHALAWPLFALLGAAWWWLRVRRGGSLRAGLLAHAAALAAGLPWVLVEIGALGRLHRARPAWMTEPDLGNFLRVFAEWLPYGRHGWPAAGPAWIWAGLGGLTLAPFACAFVAAVRRRRTGGARDGLAAVALAGGTLSIVFVLALWIAHRAGWVFAFHGPRYPGLVAGIWATSAVLAVAPRGPGGRRRAAAWLLLAPWLLTSTIGNVRAVRTERRGGLAGSGALLDELGGDAPRFFAPSGLEPFFRRTLAGLGARPVESMACELGVAGRAVLIQLNRWREVDFPEELQLHAALSGGLLAATPERRLTPTGDFFARRVALDGSDATLLSRWCEEGMALVARPALDGAPVAALPERQRASDGWSYLEFDRDLVPYRWTAKPGATLRFTAPLPTGRSNLRLIGYREPRPARLQTVRLAAPCSSWSVDLDLPPGSFDREIALELPERCHGAQTLVFEHPLWKSGADASGDARELGIQLRGAASIAPESAAGGG